MSNLFLSRLAGTLQQAFRIGSALLKTDTGALLVRNAADTTYLPIEAAGLKVAQGAVNGYVWTSDADGNGSWQAATGGGTGGGSGLRMTMLTVEGELSTGVNPLRIYNTTGADIPITKVFLAVSQPPDGASIIVDVNMDGLSIFTDQNHRPQIPAGYNTGETTLIDVPTWAVNSYLTMGVNQVGTSAPGEDLTVHIMYWTVETEAGGTFTIQETDGDPTIPNVSVLRVPSGTLTDEGSGIVRLDVGTNSGGSAAEVSLFERWLKG